MPWNCFKSPVFIIKYAAFFAYEGWVNIFLHSTTPKGSFRCSSLHVSLLKRVSLWHSDRICRTVWDLWPHSHWLLFTIFQPYKKPSRPIFPVLICVISALSGFLILLCSCKTLVLGVGARARSSFPFDSAEQDSAHLMFICCLCTSLIAALRRGIKTFGAVLCVSSSTKRLFRCFLSFHPVDSWAALSAFSFPSTPECAGTQWSSIWIFLDLSSPTTWEISIIMICPDWRSGLSSARIAAWLSVNIITLWQLSDCGLASARWRAPRIPTSSAEYTV